MAKFKKADYSVARLVRLWEQDRLTLQPKFQRRAAWENAARSYLIDTVLRALPMPKIYLRRIVNETTGLEAYEVVDGQQRLRAIIDYRQGTLRLRRTHNRELGNRTFSELPDIAQRAFLDYELSAEIMDEASDPEVWGLFERLNTYTLTLNRQERLNAKWFGLFKQTAYALAAEESALQIWADLRIFTDLQIARMKEVELTSDIMVAVVYGISDMTDIARAYKDFDDSFPEQEMVQCVFGDLMAYLADNLAAAVRRTRFRNRAWCYSLMVAIADAQHGITQGLGPRELQPAGLLTDRLYAVNELLSPPKVDPAPIPRELVQIREALYRSTSHVPQRLLRHDFFFQMLTAPQKEWRF